MVMPCVAVCCVSRIACQRHSVKEDSAIQTMVHSGTQFVYVGECRQAIKRDPASVYVGECRQAIKRDPASVKALLRAGHAHLGLHAPCQAAEMFQQALQLDSRSAAAKVWAHLCFSNKHSQMHLCSNI